MKYFLMLLPSFLHIFIRKMLGAQIGSGTRLRFGTIIRTANKHIKIGEGVSIGPFAILSGDSIIIGKNSMIKPFSLVSAKNISIGSYVQIAPLAIINGDKTPRSKFIIGNHSRIFPFCWIDTGEGVTIGNHVGIGGHTLIFTHGVWTNYLEGGPVTYGEVVIEDEVWLPWRVFVMPGVVIGKKTVVGANSVVTKSVAENSLIAGSPAKVIRENFIKKPSIDEQQILLASIFKAYVVFKSNTNIYYKDNKVYFNYGIISSSINDGDVNNIIFLVGRNDDLENGETGSLKKANIIYHPLKVAYIQKDNRNVEDFISFLRRYGIRLSKIYYN